MVMYENISLETFFKSTRKLSTQLLQVRENIGIFKSRRKILQLDSKLSRCWGKISCNIWKHNCFLCNLLLGRRENAIREMKVSLYGTIAVYLRTDCPVSFQWSFHGLLFIRQTDQSSKKTGSDMIQLRASFPYESLFCNKF